MNFIYLFLRKFIHWEEEYEFIICSHFQFDVNLFWINQYISFLDKSHINLQVLTIGKSWMRVKFKTINLLNYLLSSCINKCNAFSINFQLSIQSTIKFFFHRNIQNNNNLCNFEKCITSWAALQSMNSLLNHKY